MNISKCGRFGLQVHRSDQCRCTRDKRCHKGNRVEQFAIMYRWKQRKSQPHGKNSVHFLDDQDQSSDSFSDTEASAQVYALDSQSNTTTITIANVPIQVTIDSGASCNVLNTADSEKLASYGLKLRTCNRTLFPYNSPPLKITLCLVADVQFHDGPSVSTEFLVLPGSQSSLFGRDTAETLQILKIVNQVSTPSPLVLKNPYLDKCPGLCAGTGKLKNHRVKLHIDKPVPPVARTHSRVPFHLRDKVEKELQRLEREDIIEKSQVRQNGYHA